MINKETYLRVESMDTLLHLSFDFIGMHVMVVFPPDTQTPGFENENIGKPAETVAISRLAGIQKPEFVAKGVIEDLCKRR